MEKVKLSYQSITQVLVYFSNLSENNRPKNAYVTQEGKYVIANAPVTFEVFPKQVADGRFETEKIIVSNAEFSAELTLADIEGDRTLEIDFKKIARTLMRIVDPMKHPLAQDIDKLCNS